MKLFKKISIVALSLMLAICSGLIIAQFAPKKQTKAATSSYKYRYLSDMSVSSSFNLWETYTLNAPLSPADTINNSILLKRGAGLVDEKFTKAVVFNRSDASQEGGVVFNLSGLNATRFTAIIGVNQTTTLLDNPLAGVASFKVYGDNNLLFNDSVAYSRNSQYGYIDIDINGVSQLKLVTYDVGEASTFCEHAVFAEPKIFGTNLTDGTEGNALYISELPYAYKENLAFYDNFAINEAFPVGGVTTPLSLKTSSGNVTYSKGLCIQANDDNTGNNPAKIGWDISGSHAYRFTATIGINQRADLAESADGSVVFQVRFRINGQGDEIKYTSDKFTRSTQAQDIDIPVPVNASHIILAVLNGGDGMANDNGTFANAKLYCNFVDVSSMTASATNMGYGDLLYNDVMDGKATLYNIITEPNGTNNVHTYFDKNLFTHATSTVDFSVNNMDVNRFMCYVGITSTKVGSDGITFKVFADGVLLGSSITTVQYQQMASFDLQVPAGTNTITLSAESAIGDNNSDHAIWCAPVFFGNNVRGAKNISLTAANDSLAVGETTDFKLYYCTFDNKVIKATNFTLTSSNTSVATVSGTKVTAKAVGSSEIHVSVVIDGVTFSTYTNIVVGSATSSTNAQLNLASPDGKTKIIVTLNNGWIDYSATKGGNLFVEKSRMGVHTSYGETWHGYSFGSLSSVRTIDETYSTFSGKFATQRNYCKEQDITFNHSTGFTLKVIARAYNDGVAFRYVLTGKNNQSFTMIDENTSICLPFFSTTWSSIMPENGGASAKQYTHEQTVSETMITSFSGKKVIPYMYKTPDGIYCLMSESDLDGSYWGSVLSSEYIKIMRLGKSGQQTSNLTVSSGTLTMPWRAFMAGTLEEIVKSNMIENLAPAPDANTDWSWVDPGIASWSWMDGVNQFHANGGNWNEVVIGWQKNPEAIKKYIDLAANMGWEYFILDDGWQPWQSVASLKDSSGNINGEPIDPGWQNFEKWYDGVFDWMTSKTQYHKGGSTGYTGTKIADYAASKGVKLIAWLHTGRIDTEARMNEVFGMLQDIGIAGIKVDFFDSENQWTMDLYQKLYKKTADYHLLGIFHGSNKPTGERRTYPHVINREAIPGEELNNTKVSQQSILAYLRGTIGPSDLTPYIYTVGTGDTNMASQMAFSIIYESGLTCFASTAEEYNSLNENVKYYYKNFPDRWADLKLISGEVGDKMSIARKTLDNKWYVGCISTEATTDTFKLDFLDSGKNYIAHIYTDKTDRRAVDYKTQTVTNQTSLTLTTQANGGYVILLEEEHVCSPASTTYYSNTTEHWQLCSCGAKLNVVTHTYNQKTQAKIASSATCTSPAQYYYSCTCGAVGTSTYSYGSALGHTFTKQDTADKYLKSSATCSAKATYYKCCASCGLSSKGQTGEATFTSGSTLEHDIEYVSVGDKGHYQTCKNNCGASTMTQDHEYEGNICKYCKYEKQVTSSSSSASSQTPSTSVSSQEQSSNTSSSQVPSISQEQSSVSSPISSSSEVSSANNSSSNNLTSSSSQDNSSTIISSNKTSTKPSSSVGASKTPSKKGCSGNVNATFTLPLVALALFAIIKLSKKKED